VSVLYLYALVGDPLRSDPGRGLRRERLEVLPGHGFHVVVGRMDTPPAASPATLRRQDAIVRRIAAKVDAILPMRFGSVVPDEAAAARLLTPRAIELAGRLARVRGHEQMTLRVFGPRRASRSHALVPEKTAGARLGPGTRYLAERKRLHDTTAAPELNPILPLLDGLVADERVQRHATPPLLASVYHLVPHDRRAQYRTQVTRAASRLAPLRLTVSGPWPPYAFGADAWP
jgi:Gas vesicle synthesis protein GvpL/GvpF